MRGWRSGIYADPGLGTWGVGDFDVNIARWLIAYGICALMGGIVMAGLGQYLELGTALEATGQQRFSSAFAIENFNYLIALRDTLIMTPILALFGFVPALIIFALPEALGIRPSGMRNGIIAALFIGVPFIYVYWNSGGQDLASLLTGNLFLPIAAASILSAMILGLLRQGPLCYRKPE